MFDLGQLGYFAVGFLRTLQNRSNSLRTAEITPISQSAINQNKPNVLLRVQRRIQAKSSRRKYFSVNLEEREQDWQLHYHWYFSASSAYTEYLRYMQQKAKVHWIPPKTARRIEKWHLSVLTKCSLSTVWRGRMKSSWGVGGGGGWLQLQG